MLNKPEIGDIVYESYNPKTLGIVIGQHHKNPDLMEVKWQNGKTKFHLYCSLNYPNVLIEETAKKLESHKARLEKFSKTIKEWENGSSN